MAELWGFLDSTPVSYLLIIGIVGIVITYVLDFISSAREEWK